ncbi:glutamyl-tRNA amidotransferase [Campylobacter concisus]|uniref:glutamyl-tRNA amidotransferase n=1 Tax=Campylobacter concisus TaxID=199 RepID=UPI000CD845AB|nr:glutamyl-tRNA amidotransferase [Campylobacter concisus]
MGKLKLTDKTKEQIIADYKAGISQNQLAKNYKLSPATINKLCKNIPQENVEIVNTLVNTAIATNRALEGKSQIEVNSIERIVDERTRHLLYFQNAALRNQKIADEMLEMSDKIADVEAHSRITARNKETVLGREADTVINNANVQSEQKIIIERKELKGDE